MPRMHDREKSIGLDAVDIWAFTVLKIIDNRHEIAVNLILDSLLPYIYCNLIMHLVLLTNLTALYSFVVR